MSAAPARLAPDRLVNPLPLRPHVEGAFTLADLADRFGALPAERIHTRPAPGTATRADADRLRAAGFLCELVEGTLIEKAVSQFTSFVAARLIEFLGEFVHGGELGWVIAPDGFVDLYGGTLQRAPDVSVVLNEQQPGGLVSQGWAEGAPALCIEVFSRSNTRPEMERKRREYFENGCRLCWTFYPATDGRPASVEVHTPRCEDGGTGPDEGAGAVLGEDGVLDGGPVLPGFALPVARAFRRGA